MTFDFNQLKQGLDKTTVVRRVNKKEFINDLKAIPTNFVEIQMTEGDYQILIKQPQGYKYVCHIAKG
jgi:hypothetical protein